MLPFRLINQQIGMKMAQNVAVSSATDQMLTELAATRKNDGALVSTKGGIVAQAVIALYKKEVKK